MEAFTIVESVAAPLRTPNVDTDRIIRIERCAAVPRERHGDYLLETMRFRADGTEVPDFILNRAGYRDARILIAAENFGCGSSRENAVWAIRGFGIRAVIAPSFGDIFYANCFQNGVLPIRLAPEIVDRLASAAERGPADAVLRIDLARSRIVTPAGDEIPFEVDPLRKRMMLEGLDEIALTLEHDAAIAAHRARDRAERPWVYDLD